MKRLLLALGILALICSPALAANNSNGALVAHSNDAVAYTCTNPPYCGAAYQPGGQYIPGTCEALRTVTTKFDPPATIFFLWAFLPGQGAAVGGIQFGVNHTLPPGAGYVACWGVCGPNPQLLPDAGFPDTPGGCLIGYQTPVYSDFAVFMWSNVYGEDGVNDCYGTGVYPGDGQAKFADDSIPPQENLIFNFGRVCWGTPGGNQCPEPPPAQGACCFPDGSCVVTEPDQCAGEYQGDDTVCDPNPCRQPGACCFEDGHCELIFQEHCQGTWYGGPCDPNPCPPPPVFGACCFPDGSCVYTEESQCTTGVFFANTLCDPNPCPPPPPRGACCYADGTCQETLEADCTGDWQGADTHCDPNPCPPPVPTENTTWGQIKANYR